MLGSDRLLLSEWQFREVLGILCYQGSFHEHLDFNNISQSLGSLSLVELAHVVFQLVRCSAPQGVGQAAEALLETQLIVFRIYQDTGVQLKARSPTASLYWIFVSPSYLTFRGR